MRSDANIREVANLGVDFMGFIFYAKSPRCAVPTLSVKTLNKLPSSVLKVGVFVNETTDIIRQRVAEYGLDLVQLHCCAGALLSVCTSVRVQHCGPQVGEFELREAVRSEAHPN